MSTTEILTHLYTTILTGESTQSIKLAQKELLAIESSPFFVYANMALLFSRNTPLPIKKLISTCLNNFVNRLVDKKNPPQQQLTLNLDRFLFMLRSPLLQFSIKSLLKRPTGLLFKSLLSMEGQRSTYNQKFFKFVLEAQRNKEIEVDPLYMVLYAEVFVEEQPYEKTQEIVKLTFPVLCKLTLRIQEAALTRPPVTHQQLHTELNILKEYSQMIRLYFKRYSTYKFNTSIKFDFLLIQKLLISALNLTSPANATNTFLYTYVPDDEKTSKLLNTYKANYLCAFSSMINVHLSNKSIVLPQFPAINELIIRFLASTELLLHQQPYYKLKQDHMLHFLLDKTLYFLYWCNKLPMCDHIFMKISGQLLEKVLLPCIEFSPNDLRALHEEDSTEDFVNTLYSLINEHVAGDYIWDDDYKEDQRYQTIKSTAAALIISLSKKDKTLKEYLVKTAVESIKSKEKTHRNQMILILLIVGSICKEESLIVQIEQGLRNLNTEIKENPDSEEQLQLALSLLCYSHLYPIFQRIQPDINKQIHYGVKILLNPSCVSYSFKRLANLIFEAVARDLNNSAYDFQRVILTIYNSILPRAQSNLLFIIHQYCEIFLKLSYDPDFEQEGIAALVKSKKIQQAISLLSDVIKKELRSQAPRSEVFDTIFKIYKQITQIENMDVAIITLIQETMISLLESADLAREIEYQTSIYDIVTSSVKESQRVNKNQLAIIKTIPKFFYSKNARRFKHIFQVVQIFLNFHSEPSDLLPELLKMCLDELVSVGGGMGDEDYACEGVLLLHSIVSLKNSQLKREDWQSIILTTLKTLEVVVPECKQYYNNLNALLALCLAYSYKYFSQEENDTLIARIISSLPNFTGDYSSQPMILGLSQLLDIPEYRFVGLRFTSILNGVISLLQQNRKHRFEFHLNKTKYQQNVSHVKGPIREVAFSFFFDQKIKKMKPSNLPIFQRSFSQLTKDKQDYFYEHVLGKKKAEESKGKKSTIKI